MLCWSKLLCCLIVVVVVIVVVLLLWLLLLLLVLLLLLLLFVLLWSLLSLRVDVVAVDVVVFIDDPPPFRRTRPLDIRVQTLHF